MLKITELRKTYANAAVPAIDGVSLTVETGEFYTLLGPSGCGKSTTLQCVAGLETPDDGIIDMNDVAVYSRAARVNQPGNRRDIGMVFQSYAIWPHMTVYENVAFPLRYGRRKIARNRVRERVMSVLERVQLEHFAEQPAPLLSGGQQQRVALARALVHEPALLLLDEPLSNLDAKLRDDMRIELQLLVKKLGTTTLYVTHDQVEAMSMSDRIAVMRGGVIVQEGSPREIYGSPSDPFVAEFIGNANFVPGLVQDVEPRGESKWWVTVDTAMGSFRARSFDPRTTRGRVLLAIRPEVIDILDQDQPGSERPGEVPANLAGGEVTLGSFMGDRMLYIVRVGEQELRLFASERRVIAPGQGVRLTFPPERTFVVPHPEAQDGGDDR